MARGRSTSERIAALRQIRPTPKSAPAIAGEVAAVRKEMARRARSVSTVGERWGGLVPAAIAGRVALGNVQRGVLTVTAADASAKFALIRWLSSGGEAVLREQIGGVRIVKVVLAGSGGGGGAGGGGGGGR